MPAYKRHGSCCCSSPLNCACPFPPADINMVCSRGPGARSYHNNVTVSQVSPTSASWSSGADVRAPELDATFGGTFWGHHILTCLPTNGLAASMIFAFTARNGTSGPYTVTISLCNWVMASSPNTCTPFAMVSGANQSGTPSGTSWTGSG
jgi:hypothetical protein